MTGCGRIGISYRVSEVAQANASDGLFDSDGDECVSNVMTGCGRIGYHTGSVRSLRLTPVMNRQTRVVTGVGLEVVWGCIDRVCRRGTNQKSE